MSFSLRTIISEGFEHQPIPQKTFFKILSFFNEPLFHETDTLVINLPYVTAGDFLKYETPCYAFSKHFPISKLNVNSLASCARE